LNSAHFSQGKVAAGFTSTVMEPLTMNKAAILDEDIVKLAIFGNILFIHSFLIDILG
jgi:hypothetical protein